MGTIEQRPRYWIAISAVALCIVEIFVLFLVRQLTYILCDKTLIFVIYGYFYIFAIIAIPLFILLYIAAQQISGNKKVDMLFNGIYANNKRLINSINYVVYITVIAIISIGIVFELICPAKMSALGDLTVLYDKGSLNSYIVRTLIAPIAIDLDKNGEKVGMMELNNESIEKALHGSKYLIILSHGGDGKLYSTNPLVPYGSDEFRKMNNGSVKFAYFSACDLGINGNDLKWKSAMLPGKTVLYDRDSGILEHIIWLNFKGRNEIRQYEKTRT
jgi:hypothetical protein